jgi:hypothetical protein
MKQLSTLKVTFLTLGLWILSMSITYFDQFSLDSAVWVTLLCANLGLLLNLTKDTSTNKQEIKDLKATVGDLKNLLFKHLYKSD